MLFLIIECIILGSKVGEMRESAELVEHQYKDKFFSSESDLF